MIIPGLVFKNNYYYDVLRGEETLAIGVIEKLKNIEHSYLCCPGTHSKWISIRKNKIQSFSTFMTGDLYSAISSNTILNQSLNKNLGKFSKSFYNKGLNFIHKNKEISISNILFKIRTMDLFNQNKTFERNSFLSGLIIGMELNEILNKKNIMQLKVILIATKNLTKLYSYAFNYYKIKYQLINSDECFINGVKKIYDFTN
jgi:2-dehydro-3-deoxygalactonokinase